MISLGFGTPGGGKTTFGTYCALRAQAGHKLRFGGIDLCDFSHYRHIYTNFCVDSPGISKFDLSNFGKSSSYNSLFILDEVAQLWDARNWKSFDNDVKFFFALHRHYKCDIILLSQGYADCDLRIRNLAEQTFLIEPSWFSFSKITSIVKYARLENGTINEGYEPYKSSYIYRPAVYPYFDSYAAPALSPAPDPDFYTLTPPTLALSDRILAKLCGFPSFKNLL